MIQSNADLFKQFIDQIKMAGLLTEYEVSIVLLDFDGVSGVVRAEFFITAYEALGRALAIKCSPHDLSDFIRKNQRVLQDNIELLYYFVESIVDQISANGSETNEIIKSAPKEYRKFLIKKFPLSDI